MKSKRHRFLSSLMDTFYPRTCYICQTDLAESEEVFCTDCLLDLPLTHHHTYPNNDAETLMAGRIAFHNIACYCYYTKGGAMSHPIHQLKYHGAKHVGRKLGRLFASNLLQSDFLDSIDYLVPIPLHPKKLAQRGYNQAEQIAIGMSEVCQIPIDTTTLVRTIHNPTQTKRTRTQRWANVDGIFSTTNPNTFANKHILLIDDILTTGSTIEACGVALKPCVGLTISIATIGKTS